MTLAAIVAHHISKRFTLRRDRADSVGQLLARMLPGGRPPPAEPFWALHDVSFIMSHGRSLGIIGPNGAGKSTLLKILTRTMQPTSGTLTVSGRTSALIELGAGFHPDFTGRENIILNASILGVTRREIERRMSDIIDFSGIAPFIDTPVKYYSSGMHARLGFSVAIHVDPEILVVDEVLAVGDQAFQEQCMKRIFQLKRAGVSILLVTHGLDAVETLMDDALWLDHGRVMSTGKPLDVVNAYRKYVAHNTGLGDEDGVRTTDARPCPIRILACHAGRTDGHAPVASGEPVAVALRVDNTSPEAGTVHLRILLRRPDGLAIAEFSTRGSEPLTLLPGTHNIRLDIAAVPLVPGTYDVGVTLSDPTGSTLVALDDRVQFVVWSTTSRVGVCLLPHSWHVS